MLSLITSPEVEGASTKHSSVSFSKIYLFVLQKIMFGLKIECCILKIVAKSAKLTYLIDISINRFWVT